MKNDEKHEKTRENPAWMAARKLQSSSSVGSGAQFCSFTRTLEMARSHSFRSASVRVEN